jgi:sulfur relay (sulfurtransferase) DsrC/TusE family protein
MVKAGKNGTGKQRYKCNICNTRTVINKEEKTKRNELKLFVKWLIDRPKISDKVDMSRSTFHRKTSWCWVVRPKIKSDEISSDFIFVDATYINKNLCLLIVRNDEYVLGFRWAESENFEDYYELLKPLKEPKFVISDGHNGIIKASRKLWKNIGIQRCLVHITRNAEKKLGKRSPCEINHIFRLHIKKLHRVDTVKKSQNWLRKFNELYEEHKAFIEQITPNVDIETGEVLRFYRTHKNLFSACNMIKNLLKKNMLFLYLENGIPNNSNRLEGGINSPLKNLLRCHRGISLEHQKRMFEWYLLSRSNMSVNEFINALDLDELYPKNDT